MINGPWLQNSIMAKRGLATGEAGNDLKKISGLMTYRQHRGGVRQ